MARTVAEKMGIRPGWRALLVDAPADAVEALALPEVDLRPPDDEGPHDYVHLFVRTQQEMDEKFPRLRDRLDGDGRLWLSWPKGGRLGTDLTLPRVIRIGYTHGLVESTTLAVDSTWSAIRFTRPRRGTTYRNSFGTLPDDAVRR